MESKRPSHVIEHPTAARVRRTRALSAAALLLATPLWLAHDLRADEQVDTHAQLDALSWMAGCWGTAEGTSSADECWLERRGSVMMGFHIDVFESGQVFFEYLRIVSDGETVNYMASPMGAAPTPFTLVDTGERRAVFENPDHDWPQRITYWRDGDRLHAQAEGLDDSSRKASWVWQLRTDS